MATTNNAPEWRAIPDYPRYEISDEGRVRCVAPISMERAKHGQLYPFQMKTGQTGKYQFVMLNNGDGEKRFAVARLVLITFVGPPPFVGAQAAHIDGKRSHNRVRNLYWATPQQNIDDRARHGTTVRGGRIGTAKLSESSVIEIRCRHPQTSKLDLAQEFGVSRRMVNDIINYKRWKHI